MGKTPALPKSTSPADMGRGRRAVKRPQYAFFDSLPADKRARL
jgi:hypothetical protein